jgi:hypothetical protein
MERQDKLSTQQKAWLVSRGVSKHHLEEVQAIWQGLRINFRRWNSELGTHQRLPKIGFLANAYMICGGDVETLGQAAENTRRFLSMHDNRRSGPVLIREVRALVHNFGETSPSQ